MSTLTSIFIFVLGLAIGSFLNVCIYRIPLNKSIIFPASFCPKCGMKISIMDNFPLVSFILLKGRCRNCQAPISIRYPIVELITALLFLLIFFKDGLSWQFLKEIILCCSLIIIFFIDLEHRIIPDVITLPGIVVGFIFSFLTPPITFLTSLLGFLAGGLLFYLTAILGEAIFKKEGMGGGDVKLAAMLGAFLGWQNILVIFFLSAVLGSIGGIIAIFLSSEIKKTRIIPFGPFIALAAIITVFWGDQLINFYLRTFLHLR
jgi:leader peptidase (prepilin peptidase)/N-methyltransferase